MTQTPIVATTVTSTSPSGRSGFPLWAGFGLIGLLPIAFLAGRLVRPDRPSSGGDLEPLETGDVPPGPEPDAEEASPDPAPDVAVLIPSPDAVGRVGWWTFGPPTMARTEGEMTKKRRVAPIPPVPLDSGAQMWTTALGPPRGGIFTEKIAGHGEDAEPTFLRRSAPSSGRSAGHFDPTLIAVYDGLGGSGARRVRIGTRDDVSQAYVASRVARDVTEAWFMDAVDAGSRPEGEALQTRIRDRLARLQDRVAAGSPVSRIRSRMQRPFPTTVAAIEIRGRKERKSAAWEVRALWAGDSRCYVWTASKGLQQLSADHSRDGDPLQQLVNDGPMNNVVSADDEWFIDVHTHVLTEPFVAVCASDGFHGYVQTPGMLEYHLLTNLVDARDTADWMRRLTAAVVSYTADDATFVAVAVGFDELRDLRRAVDTSGRIDHLRRTQLGPFDGVDSHDTDAMREAQQTSWDLYREAYLERMPTPRPPIERRTQPDATEPAATEPATTESDTNTTDTNTTEPDTNAGDPSNEPEDPS